MQTKKLATIFMVGAMSVLLLTFGSIQSACAGGHSGTRVTTHAGSTNTGNLTGAKLQKQAGPQNAGDGQQSGSSNAPTNEGGGGHPHHPDQ